MLAKIFVRGDEADDFLVVVGFADEVIEKFRAFIPPMAEQLGVIRRYYDRRAVHEGRQVLHLAHARAEKMSGVLRRLVQRSLALIYLFIGRAAGDAVVL